MQHQIDVQCLFSPKGLVWHNALPPLPNVSIRANWGGHFMRSHCVSSSATTVWPLTTQRQGAAIPWSNWSIAQRFLPTLPRWEFVFIFVQRALNTNVFYTPKMSAMTGGRHLLLGRSEEDWGHSGSGFFSSSRVNGSRSVTRSDCNDRSSP